MFSRFAPIFFVICSVLPVQAQNSVEIPSEVIALTNALGLPEIIEVMREEGIAYGNELAQDMFPGRGNGEWYKTVEAIYDPEMMTEIVMAGVAAEMEGIDTFVLTDFFESPLGREIISLEISAREALTDDAIDEASKATAQDMIASENPRIALLDEFIAVNDLLESNIVGALNSNLAFYTGLEQGGAFPEPLSEDQILNDVWSQEETIREDTQEWLYSYLALAYQPLSDEKLSEYIDISMTTEGQALNKALFLGFDMMFNKLSLELGLASAGMMVGEDI